MTAPALIDKRKSHPAKAGRPPVRYMDRSDRVRRLPVTPKQYEMKSNLIKLYQLLCLNVPLPKIASVMEKPESTIRAWMKMLANDFSSLVQTDDARQIIDENIMQWNMAAKTALEVMATTKEGDSRRLQAAATFADIVKKRAEYEVLVGRVKKAPDDMRVAGVIGVSSDLRMDVSAVRDEISDGDLEAVVLTIGDAIRKRKRPAVAVGSPVESRPESQLID